MKKIISIILCCLLILSITACQNGKSNQDPVNSSIELVDQAGRTVTLDSVPEKLVSGYYISTSLLIALGQSSKLVGVESKAESRPIYKLSAPDILNLPNTGTAKNFDLEACAALNPELIILPLKLKSQAEALESMGFKTILVNPENEELLFETIRLLAAATNTKDEGEELIAFIDNTKFDLQKKIAGESAPGVYMSGNSDFLTTCGQGMYQNSLIELAGGENVAKEITDNNWASISYEQLLAWDPEYIIIPAESKTSVDDVLKDSVLQSCTAVKNGNVYKMPYDAEAWDSPIPSSVLGMVWIAEKLHSDKVEAAYLNNLIKDYYQRFYGFVIE